MGRRGDFRFGMFLVNPILLGVTLKKRAFVDGVAGVTLGTARFSSIPYY